MIQQAVQFMTQTWQTQASVDWKELDRSIFPLWKIAAALYTYFASMQDKVLQIWKICDN